MNSGIIAAAGVALAVATSASGSTWSRTYGGASASEGVLAVYQLSDGTLAAAGYSDSFGPATNGAWTLDLDADGNALSGSALGNPVPGGAQAAAIDRDGSAVFAGRHVIDIFVLHQGWIVRTDAAGAVLWSTRFASDPGRYSPDDVVLTPDGGVAAAGVTAETDAGPHSAWVVKLDATGSLEWQRRYGSSTFETAHSIVPTQDGGFIVAGAAASPRGDLDAWVLELDAAGAIEWQRLYGTPGSEEATSIVELSSGGYAVTATTDGNAAGHGSWVFRIDGGGDVTWSQVLGADEWSDVSDVVEASGGRLVVTGRIGEPGFPSNDLWLVALEADDGDIAWQRAHEGNLGDWGETSIQLDDGGFLVAGTWAWGFSDEAWWLLRTDGNGELGAACGLVRDTRAMPFVPPITVQDGLAVPGPVAAVVSTVTFSPIPAPPVIETQCFDAACAPLACTAVTVIPDPSCEGDGLVLSLDVSGGEGPVTVTWDLDGDGVSDATGNPIVTTLPAGLVEVTATATDSCATPAPSACSASATATVVGGAPGEVSDARSGEPPLLVLPGGTALVVEDVAAAVSYGLHVDAIGSWYAPSAATGSECGVTSWTSNGDGTITVAFDLPADSWVDVTASHACAEGPSGRDSFGRLRDLDPRWTGCP